MNGKTFTAIIDHPWKMLFLAGRPASVLIGRREQILSANRLTARPRLFAAVHSYYESAKSAFQYIFKLEREEEEL